MDKQTWTRGEVSQLLGISTKTLSAWERDGKIPAAQRDWRGWRVYTRAEVEAIRAQVGPRRMTPSKSGPAVIPQPPAAATEPLPDARTQDAGPPRTRRALSARNRLRGIITRLEVQGLMAEVVLQLGDGQEVVAVITRSSAEGLGLRQGEMAVAVIKATEVMVGR